MKVNRIKLATLTTTLLVAGGILTACGSNDSASTSSSSSVSSSAETSSKEEVVSGASISDKATVIEKALGSNGNWIVAITDNVTMSKDLIVSGEFHKKGDDSQEIYRKLALYSQDESHNVTDEYTLEVPAMTVKTENFNIVHGTVQGDIIVKANGFTLDGAKVDGNIVFEKEEYKTSAVLDQDDASVTGKISVSN